MDLLFIAPLFVAIRLGARTLGGRIAGGCTSRLPSFAPPGWAGDSWRWAASASRIALNYGQVYPDLHPASDPERDAPVGPALRDRGQPGGGNLCLAGLGEQEAATPASAAARSRMIRRLVVLALLVGGAVLLEPLQVPTEGVIAPRSLFLFGILLLTADTFGALAHDLGFPRLVGYLVSGPRPRPVGHGDRSARRARKTSVR